MRVYLADLGHNQLTISSDVYPIGVANCVAYAREHVRTSRPVEYRIFREPQELKAAVESAPPDVLGLSSYAWNHALASHFARWAKRLAPRVVTLLGGPNYPLTEPEMASWLRSMPEIDIAVRGPTYEGERAFAEAISRLDRAGLDLAAARSAPLPGNDWVDPATGEFVRGPEVQRIADLDEIPSPYLTGLMDPYYASGYFPMLQIARGCPFTCQYCNSAVLSNNRIYAHSVENVRRDLLHLATRVRPEVPVCFADDNFGMYPRDEEVADYIAFLQDRHGWPRYIRTTTGKNQAERIIRVVRKVRGALPMTSAVQSLNPTVLENIQRRNIRLDAYAKIQEEVHRQGLQSYGELILSMPGETRASFLSAVRELLSTGVDRISAHQLMLLHGAPLSNPDQRARFGLETRFRVVARNVGDYTGEPVIETEEMVVATPTFPLEDYYSARTFHLLLTIWYYEGNFEEAFRWARELGVEPFDVVVRAQEMLGSAPEGFRKVVDGFRREGEEELFPTREACVQWARANFAGLVSGELGGNLLSKYSMLGRFYVTGDAIDFLGAAIAACAGELPQRRREELGSVLSYLRAVLLHAPFGRTLEETPVWASLHDVERWHAERGARPLAEHRFDGVREFATRVPQERREALLSRVRTFGEHAAGLGKFTRTMFARDLRREIVRDEVATAPAGETAGAAR